MEAAMSLQPRSWVSAQAKADSGGGGRWRSGGGSLVKLPDRRRLEQRKALPAVSLRDSRKIGFAELKVSCCCKNDNDGKPTGSENFHSSVDEALGMKRKSEDVLPYLSGRCIYLVGMMGSGKTTVGKILAEALGYAFFDSDKLVEQAVGISSVAQIFKEYSEAFFRDNESQVLKDLSTMRRLVVATGGGAVIRPINWKYMKQGITIWLDVPLEALARRIAAVGTASRPLLDNESGDPYTKAFMKLTTLSEKRGKAYANADARVCLEYLADKKGHEDVCALTPMDIAIEALINIETHLLEKARIMDGQYIQG